MGRGNSGKNKKGESIHYENFDNRYDSNDALSADGEEWWNGLTQKNQEFFDFYTGSGYVSFNEEVRKADGDPKKMTKYAKRLQTAIDTLGEGKLDRNVIMHRQSSGSWIGLPKNATDEEMQAMVGKVIVDHGITSSRASKYKYGSGMFGSWNYHIKTPAGKGIGAYVANHSSCGPGEDEFFYRPGSIYRIDGFYRDSDGYPHYDMTYLGNTHDKK